MVQAGKCYKREKTNQNAIYSEPKMELISTDKRGNSIYREPNKAGGHRYWSDSIGGGVLIWDTCLATIEELMTAIEYEKTNNS